MPPLRDVPSRSLRTAGTLPSVAQEITLYVQSTIWSYRPGFTRRKGNKPDGVQSGLIERSQVLTRRSVEMEATQGPCRSSAPRKVEGFEQHMRLRLKGTVINQSSGMRSRALDAIGWNARNLFYFFLELVM